MSTTSSLTGASSTQELTWTVIKWQQISEEVKRLQLRIAKAVRENRYGKVKALQWLLTHSLSAKLLAVRRVTQSSGANTPGVDGVLWKTPKQKIEAIKSLQRRGDQPQPLRRIYIPKKSGGQARALAPSSPIALPYRYSDVSVVFWAKALAPSSPNLLYDRSSSSKAI